MVTVKMGFNAWANFPFIRVAARFFVYERPTLFQPISRKYHDIAGFYLKYLSFIFYCYYIGQLL